MAPQDIYTIKGLGKVHPPDHQVLKDIWLSFYPGAKIGVLGLNGAGKSSLLKIMAGEDTRFVGEAFPAEGIKIGFLPQEPRLNPALDVRGNVEQGVAEVRALLERYDEINAKFGEDLSPDEMDKVLAEQGRVQDRIDQVGAWEIDSKIEMAMDALRCPPGEADVATLSGGERRRVALEEKAESKRQRTLQRELEWIRLSPRARQAKGKARLTAYEQLLAADTPEKTDSTEIYIAPGPRLGDVVVEARKLRKGYGDVLLMDDVSFTLPPGGIVGVIGPNGAGKTTLFRMLVGQEKPDAGTLRLGETVQIGYVDQSRELNADNTVWKEITGGEDELTLGKRTVASRAYCSWFNFKGSGQQRKVGTLSGGERNRVHLAKLLRSGANLLLLDEPTNDLDVDTLRALEDALLNFAGCAVVISHDRWFLDRIATHILAFEGDSEVVWFEGNHQDYEADRKTRLGAAADQPHRIKYRKLTRS